MAGEILHLDLEAVEFPLNARQVQTHFRDHVLLEMEKISIRAINEFRERCVQSLLVRALHAQNGALLHEFSSE